MAEPVFPANRGITVQDTVAAGNDQESQSSWLRKHGINLDGRIRLRKLSYMRYQHPNLDETHRFLLDFGLEVAKKTDREVWYKGHGPDQYVYYARKGPREFLGGVFEAATQEDFDQCVVQVYQYPCRHDAIVILTPGRAARLPTAGAVEELHEAPGGGRLVTIVDPEGFPFNIVYGQQPVEQGKGQNFEQIIVNFPDDKKRVRQFNRFKVGPAAVYKLGHYGVCTLRFEELLRFYTSTFNFVPTDLVYTEEDGERTPITSFMHLDLGPESVDHHAFFIASNPKPRVHHSSFEVYDFDAQQLGHQWLEQKGHRPAWGIGRHILGSQIFDYWWDVSGFMVEHYADGDLVNEDTPIGWVKAGLDTMAVWGPKVTASFLEE